MKKVAIKNYLAHMILAIVDVNRAIFPGVTGQTLARVITKMIPASGSVFARIKFFGAERYFNFAIFSHETGLTFAFVREDRVVASCIIFAFVIQAIVDVDFATDSRVSRGTDALKSSFFQNLASSGICAGVTVASIDHVLAVLAVISGSTSTEKKKTKKIRA